jgi:hypothetical protein
MTPPRVSAWSVWGLYAFAAVLVLSPLIDLFTTIWPPRFTDLQWRYGFFGLSAGYLHTPLLGLVLAMAIAFWEGHTGTLRSLGSAALVVAVILLPVVALWPMDVVQMRALRAVEAQRGIAIGGVIQELKYAGACLVLGLLGIGALKTASAAARAQQRDSPGIVPRG